MRYVKFIGLGLAVGVGVLLIAIAGENLRGKKAWEKFRKEWEAKGEVFDYKKILPKPVPTEKNFAHTPLLKPLFNHEWDKDLSEGKPRDPEAFKQATALFGMAGKRPDLASWPIGKPINLAAWQKFFRTEKGWPKPDKAGEPADDILAALKKFEKDLATLSQAARDRPLCRFDIKYEATFAALLPHMQVLRNAARAYTLRALAQLAKKNSAAALADVEMSLFLVECLADEPILISQLVRIAILKTVLQPVWEGLRQGQWTAAQLAVIDARLGKVDMLKGYALAFRGERDLGNLMIDRLRDGAMANAADILGAEVGKLMLAADLAPAGWIDQNKVRLNRLHMEFTFKMVDLKARRVRPDVAEAFDDMFRDPPGGPYNILVNLLMPAIGRVSVRTGEAQASVDMARIACQLEAHKLAKGVYPKSLAALNAAPKDVYSGKPYRFKPLKDRHLIYSLGWNEKDDGGQSILKPKAQQRDEEKADLVWQYTPVR